MPLYKIVNEGNPGHNSFRLDEKRPTTYASENLKERQHLQALLLSHPEAIDPDLLVLSEEFHNWEDSNRGIDILALDNEANLVVVELKIEEEGGHMELQAIRYAAMVSTMDFAGVVSTLENFLGKSGRNAEKARHEVLEHLGVEDGEDPIIGNRPRIILVAPSFSKEITTSVLWLNATGLDIRCLEAKPYNLDGSQYLNIQQVLPLPSAADYTVRLAQKAIVEEKRAKTYRNPPTVKVLLKAGILLPGQRLRFLVDAIGRHRLPESLSRGAEFLGTGTAKNQVRWDEDGKTYTLSNLTVKIYELSAGAPPTAGYNGTAFWGREGVGLSLWEEGQTVLNPLMIGEDAGD